MFEPCIRLVLTADAKKLAEKKIEITICCVPFLEIWKQKNSFISQARAWGRTSGGSPSETQLPRNRCSRVSAVLQAADQHFGGASIQKDEQQPSTSGRFLLKIANYMHFNTKKQTKKEISFQLVVPV